MESNEPSTSANLNLTSNEKTNSKSRKRIPPNPSFNTYKNKSLRSNANYIPKSPLEKPKRTRSNTLPKLHSIYPYPSVAEGALKVVNHVKDIFRRSPLKALTDGEHQALPLRRIEIDSDEGSEGFASALETTLIETNPARQRGSSPLREITPARQNRHNSTSSEDEIEQEMAQNDDLALALLQTIQTFNGERTTTFDNWLQQLASIYDITRWNDQQKLQFLLANYQADLLIYYRD